MRTFTTAYNLHLYFSEWKMWECTAIQNHNFQKIYISNPKDVQFLVYFIFHPQSILTVTFEVAGDLSEDTLNVFIQVDSLCIDQTIQFLSVLPLLISSSTIQAFVK